MQTTSSLVLMESVLVNGYVAMAEMTVVMVQMNSNVVSLLSLSPGCPNSAVAFPTG